MVRSAILCFLAALIGGCAHTCVVETFYSPIAGASTKATYRHKNGRVLVDLAPGFAAELFECGTAYRGRGGAPAFICITLFIDEGHTVRFESLKSTVTVAMLDVATIDLLRTGRDPKLLSVTLLGGVNSACGGISRSVAGPYCWKDYDTRIDLPPISASEFLVMPPSVLVDGMPIPFPKVMFKRVTEDMCHLSV